jgi:hypothetical protein
MVANDGLLPVISDDDGHPMIAHDGFAAMVTDDGLLPVIPDHYGQPMIAHDRFAAMVAFKATATTLVAVTRGRSFESEG